jgi:hypothetical protein
VTVRELTEPEKWGPSGFSQELGETIKRRIRCQWLGGNYCVAGATMKAGRQKLCRTHTRKAQRIAGAKT